jgi:hypothetical protein
MITKELNIEKFGNAHFSKLGNATTKFF